MNRREFDKSLENETPAVGQPAYVTALWWDAKGDWGRAHGMVDESEFPMDMAVHAYLHRKEGALGNAEYWYSRAGRNFHRPDLSDERDALLEALLDSPTSR